MGIFTTKEKWKNFSGNINILSDLKKSDIPKIIKEDNIHSLQLYQFQNPKKQTWETLNEFFKQYPHIRLRVLWFEQQDLLFFKEIPNVRKFSIASFNTKDYSTLLSNTKLTYFGIEETKSTAVDLSFIKEFQNLESLYVDGMKKGLENVKQLKKLRTLTFRGIKLDNLDFLMELNKLEELNLLLGSYKNLDSISNLKQLKSIEFSRVRQIPNFDFLNSLESLEKIEFEGMSKMEVIPNLSNLRKLKRVHLHNNLRLKDIKSVGQIPNLKVFQLSFAENSNASERKNLIEQSVKILLTSDTIEYSNIMHWTDEETTRQLNEKGVKKWNWDIEI
ncbi:protein phosphatase 1 regulatory subunit 42 [Belliella sp. DSM 107340]|uniref:Protein phosphatase 1 regulatory subunit 42 n=1 Tax=Belliella calami TaxID=2923436 RepID=A0ABS9UUI9_9BACT|nr:protein phosphatase 1 regulatory subunit 42 [Belliella calami]MCH7400080.1 protein phosphatase 1 regulatory subunit 42 [Belliella calami]